jgi:hypothetical protein
MLRVANANANANANATANEATEAAKVHWEKLVDAGLM